MKLIITEKPSVAKDIAKVLKISNRHDGYFQNHEFTISWAYGHLIRLADPPAYNPAFEKWQLTDLPIIPEKFITEVQTEEHIQKQFDIIKALIQNPELTEVICATDAGREGELIFRMIYEMTQCDKPIQRLWISSQTDQAIKEGFANLKSGDDYIPLYLSAKSRSEADWIVGINATRAYTGKFSRGHGVMSVGRVQTPVLKLIVDRYRANTSFESQVYYEIETLISHQNGEFSALWMGDISKPKSPDSDLPDSRIPEKKLAKTIHDTLKSTPQGTIIKLTPKVVNEKPPLPYDLTELQKDANKKFKYSADETLKLMQSLYERHKILSYPRTSSRYLSQDIKPKIPGLLHTISQLQEFAPMIKTLSETPTYQNSRIFDDKKVTDHHAIIPTDQKPNLQVLTPNEKNLYLMVIRRFVASLMEDCIKHQTEVITQFGNHQFRSFGSIINKAGWREAYGQDPDQESDTTPQLPTMVQNDPVTQTKPKLCERKTKPPALYTEASILAAMETAGKNIEDEDLRQAMKHCGLGTPATRAQIIERLITVQYILREKNRLIPTPKGIQLIDYIQDKALLSAEMTGDWELKLNQIVNKEYERTTYMEEIKNFTKEIIENVKSSELEPAYAVKNPLGNCPLCQNVVGETKMAYSCSQWKATGCTFKIWKVIASKEITESMAKTLLKNKKTALLKGFKSKTGNEFSALLTIAEDGRIVFEFDNSAQESIGPCPKCKAPVVERKVSFGCSSWKETGCNFVIWKESTGKITTKEMAIAQLKNKD